LVTEGKALVKLEGAANVPIAARDIVVFPHGDPHVVTNGAPSTLIDSGASLESLLADDLATTRLGGRGHPPEQTGGWQAILYYISVSLAVYLLSVRYRVGGSAALTGGTFSWGDGVNLVAFGAVVFGLIGLMGVANIAAMIAALYVFLIVAPVLLILHILSNWRMEGRPDLRALVAPLGRLVDNFAAMTADLTLLLGTLSIMTGAFVITGVPTKIGVVLIEAAGINLAAMVLVAFVFGALLGTGLPPAPTYILTALVIAPPMIRQGVDPWVVHFFAFFLAVWGELTPPTSVVAAVTAKIADAPFLATLMRAILICVSLFMLMAGVFVRPELVLEPGLAQLGALGLILTATIGIIFSIQAQFSEARALDLVLRLALVAASLVVLLHPRELTAALSGIPVLALVAYWFLHRQRCAARAEHTA
jgi:TRAP-type uncharacterized transport system fused permease subunit